MLQATILGFILGMVVMFAWKSIKETEEWVLKYTYWYELKEMKKTK